MTKTLSSVQLALLIWFNFISNYDEPCVDFIVENLCGRRSHIHVNKEIISKLLLPWAFMIFYQPNSFQSGLFFFPVLHFWGSFFFISFLLQYSTNSVTVCYLMPPTQLYTIMFQWKIAPNNNSCETGILTNDCVVYCWCLYFNFRLFRLSHTESCSNLARTHMHTNAPSTLLRLIHFPIHIYIYMNRLKNLRIYATNSINNLCCYCFFVC